MLLKKLPADSWTQTALRDSVDDRLSEITQAEPKFGPWALDNYQLAGLIDEVASLRFVVARAAGWEKYPAPEPLPRPGLKAAKPQPRQTEAAVVYLDKLRARREG